MRYALLRHNYPYDHYDFLLEDGDACLAWRLPLTLGSQMPAEPLPRHRLLYLNYAGPVSNERGEVSIAEQGTGEWLTGTAERKVIELHHESGRRLLIATTSDAGKSWEFHFTPAWSPPDAER